MGNRGSGVDRSGKKGEGPCGGVDGIGRRGRGTTAAVWTVVGGRGKGVVASWMGVGGEDREGRRASAAAREEGRVLEEIQTNLVLLVVAPKIPKPYIYIYTH